MTDNDQKVFDSCSILLKNLVPEVNDITFDTYSRPLEVPKMCIFGFTIGTKIVIQRYVRITVSSGDTKVTLERLPEQMFKEIDGCIALADIIKDKLKAANFIKNKMQKTKDGENA